MFLHSRSMNNIHSDLNGWYKYSKKLRMSWNILAQFWIKHSILLCTLTLYRKLCLRDIFLKKEKKTTGTKLLLYKPIVCILILHYYIIHLLEQSYLRLLKQSKIELYLRARANFSVVVFQEMCVHQKLALIILIIIITIKEFSFSTFEVHSMGNKSVRCTNKRRNFLISGTYSYSVYKKF